LYCPQYKNLHIEDVLRKLAEYQIADQYLPDERDMQKLPRQWIVNVAYTLVGE
jgi:hypothetical protein